MRRLGFLIALTFLVTLAGPRMAPAQNPKAIVAIYLKSNPSKAEPAAIASESLQGVKLTNKAQPIPAEEIYDVDYGNRLDTTVKVTAYNPAREAEKAAQSARAAADRAKHLQLALAKYATALKNTKAQQHPMVHRHLEFKIAYLRGLLSQTADKDTRKQAMTEAVAGLTAFKTKHTDSWQYIPAMLLTARLQAATNDLKAAKATINELATSRAAANVKQDAKFQLVQILMDRDQFKEAHKLVEELLAEFPPNSVYRIHARLAEAKCLAATGEKLAPALDKLAELLKETKDNTALHAAVYNTLGECYLLKNQFQDARWQFLWVDVIYNQDKVQHARALYHLWRIFDRLNEKERAQEFFDTLMNGPQFAGLDYQRRAVVENMPQESKEK